MSAPRTDDEGRGEPLFSIIDDAGSRKVGREEFEAHIRELESPNRPRPRYEHTDEEKRSGQLRCSCQNCLDDRAAGRSFTASELRTLIDIVELPEVPDA